MESQPTNRYHRQTLLPQIGPAGQARLADAHVLLVGCGALGSVIAEQLVRAGVGTLRLVDRDVVEWTNLQRQVLFDEADARDGAPKAVAAAGRLGRVNSSVRVEPVVTDLHAGNVEALAGLEKGGRRVDVVLDGTDNVETRYLLNDVSVKHGLPWLYGACVGTDGRVMAIRPPATACLRCVFPEPPGVGELPTCDTAGVLGPVAGVVASIQALLALKLLTGNEADLRSELLSLELWSGRFRSLDVGDPRDDCPCCGQRRFVFLKSAAGQGGTFALCGRDAVQVRPANGRRLDLTSIAGKLRPVGRVEQTPFLVRCELSGPPTLQLTVFADGRLILKGTTDSDRARSVYARYIGS